MLRFRLNVFLLFIINIAGSTFYSYSLTKPTAIILDLSGVLFKENTTVLRQKIGLATLASYALTHWKNPSTVCFDLLETMSKHNEHQPPVQFKFKKKIMPRCIVEWHQGYKTCEQVQTELVNFIEQVAQENYFSSEQEKNLIRQIITLIFDREQLPTLTQPIASMIELIKQLKDAGYRLFFLTNAPHELYNTIKTHYSEIMNLFDGGIISCQTHILKPDKQMFTNILDTYQLNSQKCIFIDRKEENILAAQECGIHAITYQKTSLLIKQLKELGICIN
jgi:epoxide hydrolase-like predicted phosphatase